MRMLGVGGERGCNKAKARNRTKAIGKRTGATRLSHTTAAFYPKRWPISAADNILPIGVQQTCGYLMNS
eukprot:6001182-Amphidinium_carterae.1